MLVTAQRPGTAEAGDEEFVTIVTPLRRAYAKAWSRTSRARCETGNSLADSGLRRAADRCCFRRNAICSRRGHDRTMWPEKMSRDSRNKRDSSSPCGQVCSGRRRDQNFAAPSFVLSSSRIRPSGRPRRSRPSCRPAGTDYDDARHASSDWRSVRLKRLLRARVERCRVKCAKRRDNSRRAGPPNTNASPDSSAITLDRVTRLRQPKRNRAGRRRHRHHRKARGDRLGASSCLMQSHSAVAS